MNNQQTFCGWVSSVIVLYSTTLKGQEFSGDKWRQSMEGAGCRGSADAGLFLRNRVTCGWRRGQNTHGEMREMIHDFLLHSAKKSVHVPSGVSRFLLKANILLMKWGSQIISFKPFFGKHLNLFNRAAFVKWMRRLLLDLPVFCSASALLLLILTGVGSLCRLLNLCDSRQEDGKECQTLVTDSLGSASPSLIDGQW